MPHPVHWEQGHVEAFVSLYFASYSNPFARARADEGMMEGDALDVLKARPIVQKNHVYYSVCAE